MKFLNHMRLMHKILVIVGILLLPIGFLLYQVVSMNNAQVEFSQAEADGSSLLVQVRDVEIAAARGRVAELNKQKDPYSKMDSEWAEVKKLAETSPFLTKEAIATFDDAKNIEFKLDRIVDIVGLVADKSNLTLDPDIDSFYTMDSVTVKIPSRVMEMSDVHAILTGAIEAGGTLSEENKQALQLKSAMQTTYSDGLNTNREKSFAGNADGSLKAALDIYYKEAEDSAQTMIDLTNAVLSKGDAKDLTTAKLNDAYLAFLKANEILWEKGDAELQRLLKKRISGFIAKEIESAIITTVLLLFAMIVMWLVSHSITKPISELVGIMSRLAKGELNLVVPGQDRKEEVGDIARAVVGISESVAARSKSEAEAKALADEQRRQEAQQMEHMAAMERKKAMNDMADHFESSVGSVVDTVSSAATELRSSAESMTQISNQTTDRATAVAAATEEATASVQTVATASEQLLAAINEISQKVEESAGFTRQAVSRAQATNVTVEGLAESAKKIDNVVKMIQDIAWQTNLLALNATIEAARAGDAGKGFAVVAAEVKNLADQTSKATVDISEQISNMQTNTQDAVKAIKDISGQIGQINQISESIAAAVEEQSASTKEIALNVRQASTGTQEVAKNIVEVSRASSESGEAAAQVLGASGELSKKSEQLRGLVEEFIAQIRS
ncbi:MAG: methyl-accepting chemotaxis protein [Alphaproteobacteria bacterium]|nr:methyl-accepting chemotaxis protein [Alphaproteobacteria bacterium]